MGLETGIFGKEQQVAGIANQIVIACKAFGLARLKYPAIPTINSMLLTLMHCT
jgi:hypothetical protein